MEAGKKKFSRDDVTSFKFECMELRPRHPVRRMATWKIDGSWWGRRDVVYHAVKKKKRKKKCFGRCMDTDARVPIQGRKLIGMLGSFQAWSSSVASKFEISLKKYASISRNCWFQIEKYISFESIRIKGLYYYII